MLSIAILEAVNGTEQIAPKTSLAMQVISTDFLIDPLFVSRPFLLKSIFFSDLDLLMNFLIEPARFSAATGAGTTCSGNRPGSSSIFSPQLLQAIEEVAPWSNVLIEKQTMVAAFEITVQHRQR
jgi:hypothetical protein